MKFKINIKLLNQNLQNLNNLRTFSNIQQKFNVCIANNLFQVLFFCNIYRIAFFNNAKSKILIRQ